MGLLFGLLGKSLSHSFSKDFFHKKFLREGIDAVYCNFELSDVAQLFPLIQQSPALMGLNVTIPYKQTVMALLDELSPEAEGVGAVNCIKIVRRGSAIRLVGHNTDAWGFARALAQWTLPDAVRALVLGRGGAAKAVCYVLQQQGIPFQIVSRNPRENQKDFALLGAEDMARYHLVVNCTPLGMFPQVDACPPIPYEAIGSEHFLFDLIYNPVCTKFLLQGQKRGAKVQNGQKMLEEQALAAWNFWNSEDFV